MIQRNRILISLWVLVICILSQTVICLTNPNRASGHPSRLHRNYRTSKYSDVNKAKKNSEYSIYSLYQQKEENNPSNTDENRDRSGSNEREQLYEAYNLLHTLAQDFHKPFDAPAVIVVGHQTSGKSALIEALMGFQFNQVGGGTKTRRPIALRMQYNPNCLTPMCFLTLENGKEEQRSLSDIQAYIEAENKRLEKDSTRSFDPREINIRMEYKYCPNMIVIDTPGMIHPPKGKQLTPQQRALAIAAREAENLILNKIRCQDYIILCVEDTTDWKHATTRNIVMQADPNLSRTVLVTTKLDTKLPQFSESEDLEDFLQAPLIRALFSQMLGGPFYTSVPSGRVGNSRELTSNEAFVSSLQRAEKADRRYIYQKLGLMRSKTCLENVGISKLRSFLEARVEDSYRRNVAKIVPLLQSELAHTERKLAATEEELKSLSLDRLKQTANMFREHFARELSLVIQGTVRASPEEWGENLEVEQVKGGSFLQYSASSSSTSNVQTSMAANNVKGNSRQSHQSKNRAFDGMTISPEQWLHILDTEIGNNRNKLYGGAQYHRAMKEFTIAVRHMSSPIITEDEIANAAGIGDTHNGVNFMRAACVIAMEKAQTSFDPMLEALKQRTQHIMKRLFPIVMKLLKSSYHSLSREGNQSGGGGSGTPMLDMNYRPFEELLESIFYKFVDEQLDNCIGKCHDDLYGMTNFVTWDVEDKSGSSTLYRLLPTPQRMVEIYNLAIEKKGKKSVTDETDNQIETEDQDNSEHVTETDEDEDAIEEVTRIALSKKQQKQNKNKGTKSTPNKAESAFKIMDEWNKANSQQQPKKMRLPLRNPLFKKRQYQQQQQTSETSAEDSEPSGRGNSASTHDEDLYSLAKVSSSSSEDAELSDYYRVMQLTEEMVSGNSPSRTSALVTALVQYIISSWRNHFARSTTMKFNCFFLMPFINQFPIYLRNELDRMYDNELSEMFDIAETRRTLIARRAELLAEREANARLQARFDAIASQLRSSQQSGSNQGGNSNNANTEEGEESRAFEELDEPNPSTSSTMGMGDIIDMDDPTSYSNDQSNHSHNHGGGSSSSA